MPLTDQEREFIQQQTLDLSQGRLNQSLDSASRMNPDSVAEGLKLSESLDIPYEAVQSDVGEARRQNDLKKFSEMDISPKTADWLKDEKNAALSIDDVETLNNIENHAAKNSNRAGFWENAARGAALTTSQMATGAASEIAYWASRAVEGSTQLYDITAELTGAPKIDIAGEPSSIGDAVQRELRDQQRYQEKFYDFENRADIQKVVDNPSLDTVAEFVKESGIPNIPYLLAAGISPTLVYASIANQVAEEQVVNNLSPEIARKLQRGDVTDEWVEENVPLPSLGQQAQAVGTAIVSGTIERFAAKGLFKPKVKPVTKPGRIKYTAKEAGKGVAIEGGTEFIQESIEYAGGSAGTKNGFDVEEMLKRGLGGALTGGAMGGAVRAATSQSKYVYEQTVREAFHKMESKEAQDWLDTYITLAQGSTTNQRSPEQFQQFLDTVDPESRVYIDADVVSEMSGMPQYVMDQIDGTGADVSISMKEFLRDIAVDEERLSLIRPHVKVDPDLQSLNDLENKASSKRVEEMIARAESKQNAATEADIVFEQVRSQIVSSRRQGDATARISAELYPAQILATQERLRKRGIERSVIEIYRDIGFEVIGTNETPDGDAKVLEQTVNDAKRYSRASMYNGVKEVPFKHLPDEHKKAFEKAGIVEDREDGSRVVNFRLLDKPKMTKSDIVNKLRECMAG